MKNCTFINLATLNYANEKNHIVQRADAIYQFFVCWLHFSTEWMHDRSEHFFF
jgi:hypothetical protein